jgi:hypothetical protein
MRQVSEQFVKAQPTGKFAWIRAETNRAKYLDDCRFAGLEAAGIKGQSASDKKNN